MNTIHDGVVTRINTQDKTIRAPGHPHVMSSMELAPDQGILRAGTLLAKNSDELGVPYDDLSEVLGTGNGSTKNFSGTITGGPLEPGVLVVTDGVETFRDDGMGNLIGDAGGTGSVIYLNGSVTTSFYAAVANSVDITATAGKEVAAVLDRDVDTSKHTMGETVIHGTVKKYELLKGPAATPSACGTAEFSLLRKRHIYPV